MHIWDSQWISLANIIRILFSFYNRNTISWFHMYSSDAMTKHSSSADCYMILSYSRSLGGLKEGNSRMTMNCLTRYNDKHLQIFTQNAHTSSQNSLRLPGIPPNQDGSWLGSVDVGTEWERSSEERFIYLSSTTSCFQVEFLPVLFSARLSDINRATVLKTSKQKLQ